ncbi:NAD(P)-dependent oxidoreductase, partial [Rhizobium ruizarguesonis]
MKRVAMTGAAGRLGTLLRPFLRSHVEHLSLIDLQEPDGLDEALVFAKPVR